MSEVPAVWDAATNACDVCGTFVAWTRPETEGALYDHNATMSARAALSLPDRPHSRACSRYAHRWYLCARCPSMDFCGACAAKHAHPCHEGPVHDAGDTCALCMDDMEELTGYHISWSRPCPPPRPHPDHPSPDPPLYVEYFTRMNPGPHYDTGDDDDGESDDDYAYRVHYPGPYKDENGKQRRFVATA